MAGARHLFVACLLAAVLPATATAHDMTAPAGAAHNFLMSEGWVFQHSVPFDELDLAKDLGIAPGVLRRWLTDDHRTPADIATLRGLTVAKLADRLVDEAGVASRASKRRRELVRRTRLMLLDGHLAQHVLFHPFHGAGIPARAQELLGVSTETFLAERQAGRTPLEIAAGRDPATVRADVYHLLASSATRGVAADATSERQAQRVLTRQRRVLDCWLSTPLAKLDPTNPYGDPLGGHGPHGRRDRNAVRDGFGLGAPGGCWRTADPAPPALPKDLARLAKRIAGG